MLRQDVIVVGSGLTGMQTAIRLKEREPKLKVLVVDRAPWSMGASFKNAGFACFGSIGELIHDLSQRPEQEVWELVRKRYEGLRLLVETFGADPIGLEVKGGYELFRKDDGGSMEQALDHLMDFNTSMYQWIGEEGVFTFSSKSPYDAFKGVISNRLEGQLNMGKLYMRILERMRDLHIPILGGVEMHAWTAGSPVIVHALNGLELRCERLYLCTNAFAYEHTSEDIRPARGQVLVTEEIPDIPEGAFMHDRGYYYWRDLDGRILLGGGRQIDPIGETTSEFGPNETIVSDLQEFLFGTLLGREVRVEYQWSGIMGMTEGGHKTPIVKKLEPGVFLGARLGGMGVALSSQVALDLCDLD